MTRALASLLIAPAVVLACGDPLVERELIVDTRVLAGRVEVDGEPERAAVAPGEAATVSWLVVDPAETQPRSWRLAACLTAPTTVGVVQCEQLIAEAASPAIDDSEPLLGWMLPSSAEGYLAVVGAVCSGGAVVRQRPWPNWGCDAAATKMTLMSLDVMIHSDTVSNRNPSAADDRLMFAAAEWLAGDAPPPSCASIESSPELPVVAPASEHSIQYISRGGDREPLAEGRESLRISHFSTNGDLERAFSIIEGGDESDEPTATVQWSAPDAVGPEGLAVRFFFVVRDRRGGADWTTRQLCVAP